MLLASGLYDPAGSINLIDPSKVHDESQAYPKILNLNLCAEAQNVRRSLINGEN
jgi:hypothetical protein